MEHGPTSGRHEPDRREPAPVGRSGERAGWPRRDPDVSGILVQEYLVGGPGELGRDAGLQLVPSLTWGLTESGPDDTRWNVGGVAPGVTVRYDPVPALALLATVNPDFSQVEADPTRSR
ncbi:MAG: hypothetical protein GY913_00205 [Proteobacteria bacterium]|nr:hypothetical protein [Pseudomonadota bacterium]MCP4915319.1 hypothetical protein [Pseudomonadota bacterium]